MIARAAPPAFYLQRSAIPSVAEHRVDYGVGLKALNLAAIEEAWVPSFGVLTFAAFDSWKAQLRIREPVAAARQVLTSIDRRELTAVLGERDSPHRVIVRSSADDEGMSSRGLLHSEICEGDFTSLAVAMSRVWSHAASATKSPVALVLQHAISPVLFGHLSNERRVSRARNRWVCEQADDDGHVTIDTFSATGSDPAPSEPLICGTRVDLADTLRAVAGRMSQEKHLCHMEWVWDGRCAWIVQCDSEPVDSGGIAPGEAWKQLESKHRFSVPTREHELHVLRSAEDAAREWNKTRCVRDFIAAGLKAPRVFVMEDTEEIDGLASGASSPALLSDLDSVGLPVVVRTDIAVKDGKFAHFSGRSDILLFRDEVVQFLCDSAKELLERGLDSRDFCFLLHRVVPTYAGAFSFALPGGRRVRIDSTWGTPDSLLYYPHDSFEVDIDTGMVERQLRGKTRFVDIDEDGHWTEVTCKEPSDWSNSLSEPQINALGEQTVKLAISLNRPVKLMWLLPSSLADEMVPWVDLDEELPAGALDPASPFGSTSVLVRTMRDINDGEERLQNVRGLRRIRVLPSVELLRSEAFLDALADLALRTDACVEIEGSVLSHAYYRLTSKGVKVRETQPFLTDTHIEKYGKAVRDGIPDKIASRGERASVLHARENEYLQLLKAKAVEEALELRAATDDEAVLEELADVYEVLRTIGASLGITEMQLVAASDMKRARRGGFDSKIVLVETENAPLQGVESAGLFAGTEDEGISVSWQPPDKWLAVLNDIPRLVDSSQVEIPLVPPEGAGRTSIFAAEIKGRPLRVEVTYADKAVSVAFRGEFDTVQGVLGEVIVEDQ